MKARRLLEHPARIILGLSLLLHGCRAAEKPRRIPYVASRFSAAGIQVPVMQNLGLSIECPDDRVLNSGASQLAVLLPKELELSPVGVRVQSIPGPLTLVAATTQPYSPADFPAVLAPVPEIPPESLEAPQDSGVVNTSHQSDAKQDGAKQDDSAPPLPMALPPETENPAINPNLPPSTFCAANTTVPLNVDSVLQVRILEYRPWFPMSLTLQLTALDGKTLAPISSTSATWTSDAETICRSCLSPKERRKRRSRHNEAYCHPAPGHNSPDAFLQVVSEEIAAWYTTVSMPQPIE